MRSLTSASVTLRPAVARIPQREKPRPRVITASAPGKAVLAGEYAVLAGAPAIVAAMDRRVACRLAPAEAGDWTFVSRGYPARSTHPREKLPATPGDPAALVRFALARLQIPAQNLPRHLTLEIDSRPCFLNGVKLGIGSSAAAVVAAGAALAELANVRCDLPRLFAIHKDLQGPTGSGLDVAASWHGGVVRFRAGRGEPFRLPAGLRFAFAHAGWSSATQHLVGRFNAWRKGSCPPVLRELMACAEAIAEASAATAFLDAFAACAAALAELDRAAGIGIYSSAHRAANAAARRHRVLYKPCGAGGGDLGVAVSDDAEALQGWREAATAAGLHLVDAGIATHGLQVHPHT